MPSIEPNAGAPAPPVVLFDFDGVLNRGDAFAMFVRQRCRRAPWRWPLLLLALPWLLASWPFDWRRPMRTLVHVALLGTGEQAYRQAAKRYADQLARRPCQFIRQGLRTLRQHQSAGARVIVVTGCEQVMARRILDQLGLADVEVLGSRLAPGLAGLRVASHNIGHHKTLALQAHGVTVWQVAYGDSMLDTAMLAKAAEPVLVNGSPKLCKRMEKALGRSVSRASWY